MWTQYRYQADWEREREREKERDERGRSFRGGSFGAVGMRSVRTWTTLWPGVGNEKGGRKRNGGGWRRCAIRGLSCIWERAKRSHSFVRSSHKLRHPRVKSSLKLRAVDYLMNWVLPRPPPPPPPTDFLPRSYSFALFVPTTPSLLPADNSTVLLTQLVFTFLFTNVEISSMIVKKYKNYRACFHNTIIGSSATVYLRDTDRRVSQEWPNAGTCNLLQFVLLGAFR